MAGRDTIGILRTGEGKTATFMVPTMALDDSFTPDGGVIRPVTVVISPLTALMRDMCQNINSKTIRTGVTAAQESCFMFNILNHTTRPPPRV